MRRPALFFLSFLIGSSLVHAAAVRELHVGVAVTSDFKKTPEWKAKFEQRLAYASKIFENAFKLRFVPSRYWNWDVRSGSQDSGFLLGDLMGRFPLNEVDMMIGLTRLTPSVKLKDIRDLDVLGRTQPFSGYVVMRYPPANLFKIQEETVLIHELGHLFGAIHASGVQMIMSPIVRDQIPTAFDATNRQILQLTRGIDFRAGMRSLDPRTAQFLLNSYVRLMNTDQPFEFYYALGNLYLKLGQNEEALKALKAAQALNEHNAYIHYDLGVLYWKMDRADDAITELNQAVAGFNHANEKQQKGDALRLLGGAYYRKRDWDSAHHFWSGALVLLPNDFDLQLDLANVEMERGRFEEAIRIMSPLLKREPNSPKLLSNIGSLNFRLAHYDEAVRFLKLALERYENPPVELYYSLGYASLKLGRDDEAVDYFKESCKRDSNPNCHKELGMLFFNQNRWQESILHLTDFLNQVPDDSDAYAVLGVAWAKSGNVQAAVQVFREALKHTQDPKSSASFHSNIGNLYLQIQQWDAAMKEFESSVQRYWNNPESHFGLAIASLGRNSITEAERHLRDTLALQPGHQRAKEILSNLEKNAKA